MIVLNLYGGPGSGKSTFAKELKEELKYSVKLTKFPADRTKSKLTMRIGARNAVRSRIARDSAREVD